MSAGEQPDIRLGVNGVRVWVAEECWGQGSPGEIRCERAMIKREMWE